MNIKMNTRQKMRQTNTIIRNELIKLGFIDIVLFPHTRYSLDLYGLWDGICRFPCGKNFELYFIQCKTGYASKELKEKMQQFCIANSCNGILAENVPVKIKYKNKRGSYKINKIKITMTQWFELNDKRFTNIK